MTSNACGAVEDVCSINQDSCFFACLKIIGFKNFVRQKADDQVKQVVNDLTTKCKAIVDEVLEIVFDRGSENNRIDRGRWIDFRFVSGTIYVWTKNDERLIPFDYLLFIVNSLLVNGLKQRFPMKGVIAFGKLFSDSVKTPASLPSSSENGSNLSSDLVEAHKLETQLNWIGAILTQKAWAKVEQEFEKGKEAKWGKIMRTAAIKCPTHLFYPFSYLLWHDGKGTIAVNWGYDTTLKLTEDIIYKAFEGQCVALDDEVEVKLSETLKFFRYTQWIARLRELEKKAQDEGRVIELSDFLIADKRGSK